MKNNDNDLVSSCFEYVSNNANSILGNKIAYFREKYRIILVKSNQYTVEGFDFAKINDMLCFLVTS